MRQISFKQHRFPAEVIRYPVWLYFRFTLSLRDVEEQLAQRGIVVSREAIRYWVNKFAPLIAANLRRRRPCPTGRWHLDEMVVKIGGRRMWLWRAVNDEGVVLDMLVQKRRNTHAALKLLRKLLRNQGVHPETITTDKLPSYGAALRQLGLADKQRCQGRRINNRAENSHLLIRRREQKMIKFKSQGSAQRFLATDAEIYKAFDTQPHLTSRATQRIFRGRGHEPWSGSPPP